MAKILIIEDDTGTAEYISKHLRESGHDCDIEATGKNAVATIQRGRFDLLILDIMLPQISGFEVCRQIRKDADLYTLPVLMLTAMTGEEEMTHGLAQGADDYIVKPFDINRLVQRVESLLRANAAEGAVDELTSLPGPDATKREVQRLSSCQQAFALGYAELVHLREFGRATGPEAREKAIRRLGRALALCGKELRLDPFTVGHMGGGHVGCVLPAKKAAAYCKQARKLWLTHRDRLYESVGKAWAYQQTLAEPEGEAKIPLLDLLFCVTARGQDEQVSSQQIFETLSRIRHKALETRSGGVYLDQRAG